ncbi:FAD-binding oxidoreductase [Stigmatella sp. ncwal1]|uniref:FAD-binding oxidoreductase n=1 Tax=Stigmatella ashevillensis TaxID=2995309 RepID=A0ABT5DFW9_9BACT|nr:FAD-binding oxidoreductase [Stigmatella ashevillena]MDC0711678.1 FAD-binding oxidoreductase [Stigmatella ashevillena]
MDRLQEALDAWRRELGEAHVLSDEATLTRSRTATFATTQAVGAVLRPGTLQEVRACVQIAQQMRVPITPVSAGRNQGYGSRVPAQSGVLVDLCRMNRVLEFSEELAYLTVEPGVTFAQAHAFLEEQGSRLQLATIGGPPQASLIGNALERGDGTGPHGDIFQHVCGLEVVLPTGEVLRTGPGRYPQAQAASVLRWGAGPGLDGLFSQSNLGIVTRMTFWLAPRAPCLRLVSGVLEDPFQLGPVMERLRQLRLEGTLREAFSLWNDYKVFSVLGQYPWEAARELTPLSESQRQKLRAEWNVFPWHLSCVLEAPSEAQAQAAQERVEHVLKEALPTLTFRREEELGAGGLRQVPSARNLRMMYWRKRTPMPEVPEPERDGCGFIWLSCAVPMTASHLETALALAEPLPLRFGFEPNLCVLGVSARCAYLVVAIIYDREAEGEDVRAMECYHALQQALGGAGYYPARLGIQAPVLPFTPEDDSQAVLKALKAALDPRGILAPGRYLP